MKLTTAAAFLGVTLVAFFVSPVWSAPTPEGDGALIDLAVLVGVDLSGLGELLNRLLGAILGIAEGDKCDYLGIVGIIEGILADIVVYVDLLGIDIRVQVLLVLGPLLEAVAELLQALLGGLSIDLSIVINLVLNLLASLGLELDAAIAVRLGNLLNLDVLALVNLG